MPRVVHFVHPLFCHLYSAFSPFCQLLFFPVMWMFPRNPIPIVDHGSGTQGHRSDKVSLLPINFHTIQTPFSQSTSHQFPYYSNTFQQIQFSSIFHTIQTSSSQSNFYLSIPSNIFSQSSYHPFPYHPNVLQSVQLPSISIPTKRLTVSPVIIHFHTIQTSSSQSSCHPFPYHPNVLQSVQLLSVSASSKSPSNQSSFHQIFFLSINFQIAEFPSISILFEHPQCPFSNDWEQAEG